MFRIHKTMAWPFVLGLSILAVAGCGSRHSGIKPPASTIESVSVACSATSILTTSASTCSATVSGSGNYTSAVTWSATNGAVTAAGVFTPASSGKAIVTATSTQDSTKSGSTTLTAVAPVSLVVNVEDLPSGVAASVVVTSPDGSHTTVAATQTLMGFPGVYSLVAAPIVAGGSTYYALVMTQAVTIPEAGSTSATVDYKNVIPATTKLLDSIAEAGLTISTDGLTLTLPASSPVASSLLSGDVIVVPPTAANGVAPAGLLRKVVSVSQTGSVVTAVTLAATLADAFQRLAFDFDTQLTPQMIASVRTAPGVTFRKGDLGGHAASSNSSLPSPCKGLSIGLFQKSEPVSVPIAPSVTLTGLVEVCAGFKVSLDMVGKGFLNLQPQVNTFSATANLADFADLKATASDTISVDTGHVALGTFTFNPILVTIPGAPIPIWITPKVIVFAGANGHFTNSLTTEASGSASFTAGASYASGKWTGTPLTPSAQFDFQPPAFSTSLAAKEYAGIEFTAAIDGVIVPSFQPDIYLALQGDTTASPLWTLTGGLEGPVSIDVGIIGVITENYSLGKAFDFKRLIAAGPAISGINPTAAYAGGPAQTIQVSGANFSSAASTKFDGMDLVTTVQSPSLLQAIIPGSLLLKPRQVQVAVDNYGVGGPPSDPVHFAETSQPVSFVVNSAVAITPKSVSLLPGQSQIFQASVIGGGNVVWSLLEGSAGGSISALGSYTAPAQNGTYHVVATNAANTADQDMALVYVTDSYIHRGRVTVPLSPPVDFGTYSATLIWDRPFADTDYHAVCTANTHSDIDKSPIQVDLSTKSASSMVVQLDENTADYSQVSVDCIGIARTYSGPLHGSSALFDNSQTNPTYQQVPWDVPFADASYVAVCSPSVPANGVLYGNRVFFSAKTPTSMTVGYGYYGDKVQVDCIAVETGSSVDVHSGLGTVTGNGSPDNFSTVISWDAPFSDVNYYATCSASGAATDPKAGYKVNLYSVQQGSITLTANQYDGTPSSVEIDCIGVP